MSWDYSQTWYHGSPLVLTTLRPGSTITQDRELARVFSHKPSLVSQEIEEGQNRRIKHSGERPGFLYRLAEPISAEDVYPHPQTSMGANQEWLTRRELRVELVEPTQPRAEELLSPQEIKTLQEKVASG